ncbi:NFYB/HAP3 family transcription factor subunit [Candidatus Micrarchaeota archaeon]|nr:NFYB/HAP3 family transcription factor subunit [Candidatus Micrarchaeota archaeon]
MAEFSLFDSDAIIRRAGAQRVDEKASFKLREILEDAAKDISFKAKLMAQHAGRKSITREDILLASKMY